MMAALVKYIIYRDDKAFFLDEFKDAFKRINISSWRSAIFLRKLQQRTLGLRLRLG